MLFNELYSAYYNTVAALLKQAMDHSLSDSELSEIIHQHAFEESELYIRPALKDQRWQLIQTEGTTCLKKIPSMPLTTLQKQWLKAIGMDVRMRLFTEDTFDFPDVEPLFMPDDILIFDQYSDGDDYQSETYINNFRILLQAIRTHTPLSIVQENKHGQKLTVLIQPDYLEYSQKDDKFRLIGAGSYLGNTINLARIISCQPIKENPPTDLRKRNPLKLRSVIFELVDQRNALERVLMHFAHFKKRVQKIDVNHYEVTLFYDKEDETEIVIRILSFGPLLKVKAPVHFVNLIKQRLIDQRSCGI